MYVVKKNFVTGNIKVGSCFADKYVFVSNTFTTNATETMIIW